MNPNTHKLCKKCNSEFPHYNSGFTKCNNCPGKIINQEKKENVLNRRLYQVEQKGEIRSERKGKNLYRLTSEPRGETSTIHSKKEAYRIPPMSDKKRKAKAIIALLKGERIAEIGKKCECCGLHGEVDYSHNIPISLREDLETVKGAGHLAHRHCHILWEHLQHPKEVLKFVNLDWLLDYLWNNDKKRYYHVTDLLKIESTTH